MSMPSVYFYPHRRFRDRQLDTIRAWPKEQVVNPEVLHGRRGAQVQKQESLGGGQSVPLIQRLPLINIKFRPRDLLPDVVVYAWGAVVASGPFIVDLDNPYSLTGYNLRAMSLYRGVLRKVLAQPRCLEIRCMSEACKETVRLLFGDAVARKAWTYYPHVALNADPAQVTTSEVCRFLFVSTQFEIKGGVALLNAFRHVCQDRSDMRLDLITYLPREYVSLATGCPAIHVHEAGVTRETVIANFMKSADVLVHPTYVDSFGMVALEALSCGLGLIVTDVYALKELVEEGRNGFVIPPPVTIWDGCMPSRNYYELGNIRSAIRATNTTVFEEKLAAAMLQFARDREFRLSAKRASLDLLERRFLRAGARTDAGPAEAR